MSMKTIFLFCLYCQNLICFCQVKNELSINDSLKFEKYLKQVEKYKYDGDKIDSGLLWANKMVFESKTPFEKGLAQYAKGDLILSNNWEYNRGEFALPFLQNAVNLFAKQNHRDYLHRSLNSLSLCYATVYNPNQNQFSKHLYYLRLALKVQHDPNFKINLPFVATIKDSIASKKDIIETIKVISENLKYLEMNKSLPHQMWRNQLIGDLTWHLTKDLNQAEEYLIKSLNLAWKLDEKAFELVILSSLSLYANQKKEFLKAKLYAEEGLKKSIQFKFEFRESIFRDQLYITYKGLNEFEKAFEQKEKSLAFNEKNFRMSESKRTELLRERNLELQKNVLLEKEINKKNRLQSIYYFLILLLVATVFYFLWNNRNLSRKNKEISEAMLMGQSTERKRVAADLHDNLGSTLSSIKWSLEAIDKSKMGSDELAVHQNLNQMLDNAYNEVRLLSHNLLPEEFEKQGLVAALQYFTRKINQNKSIQFDLEIDENIGHLGKKIEFELYSICLELANNIIKHSKANKARIILERIESELVMQISDNGQGLFENNSDGKGLKNVRARVDSLGGTWEMKNMEGEGVKSIVKINI